MSRKIYDVLYEVGIWIKAIATAGEIVFGLLFFFVSSATVNRIIFFFLGGELNEQPRDFFTNLFFHEFTGLAAGTQSFWAVLLLSHGLAKIIFVIGLLKNKLWAYPASAAVFGGFVAYQMWNIVQAPSIYLEALTAFDIALISLILYEYRRRLVAL